MILTSQVLKIMFLIRRDRPSLRWKKSWSSPQRVMIKNKVPQVYLRRHRYQSEIKSLVQDVRFVEKVQSSDASVPSKTQHKPEDSPAASKDRETTLTSSPRIKRTKGEISRIVKEPQEEPKTILSMKFPPDTALPSVSELKAKFARFGPIETSDIRVSWMKS